jgi:hypothetical protein
MHERQGLRQNPRPGPVGLARILPSSLYRVCGATSGVLQQAYEAVHVSSRLSGVEHMT